MSMSSNRPYLIRALWEWIVDNQLTPHIVVNANLEGVQVPRQFVQKDGLIVLNISPTAVRDLAMENEYISFSARFAGQAMLVNIPIQAVQGIYAKENGHGMLFQESDPSPEPSPDKPPAKGKPQLKVVK